MNSAKPPPLSIVMSRVCVTACKGFTKSGLMSSSWLLRKAMPEEPAASKARPLTPLFLYMSDSPLCRHAVGQRNFCHVVCVQYARAENYSRPGNDSGSVRGLKTANYSRRDRSVQRGAHIHYGL